MSTWDHKKYGDVSHVNIAGRHFVILNTIEAMREAMTDSKYRNVFSGRTPSFIIKYALADDLIGATYSDHWVKLRKLVHTMITPYSQDIDRIENAIIEEIQFVKNKIKQTSSRAFDMRTNLIRSTANIIFVLIMGERFSYDHEIHDQVLSVVTTMDNLDRKKNLFLSLFPPLRFVPYWAGKTFLTVYNDTSGFIKHLHKNVGTESEHKDGLLYEMLLQQRENAWLSDGNVRGVIADMVLAGVLTTSSTVYSLLLIMLHKPDVQARIQEEIDSVIGRDREPCLDDQVGMPYTRAAILETLRYTPPLPSGGLHSVTDDVTFRGYKLKKGTGVITNTWLIQHDEDNWDEPWSFNPERFLDEDGQLHPLEHKTRRNLVMFGLGNRRCIGDVFARNRIFLFVTHLCQTFTFYTDNPAELPNMDPRTYDGNGVLSPNDYRIQASVRP